MEVLLAFLNRIVVQIVNPLMLLLTAGAFVVFLWGIVEFMMGAADAAKRKTGRDAMLWGLIGLTIIFGAFGIINIALRTFSCDTPGPWGFLTCEGDLPTQ